MRDAASPDQLIVDPHALLSGKGSNNGDESYALSNGNKMGAIDEQYLPEGPGEFPRTSHGFRQKAIQKIGSPEHDPIPLALGSNQGLGLNNFLEFKDQDYNSLLLL